MDCSQSLRKHRQPYLGWQCRTLIWVNNSHCKNSTLTVDRVLLRLVRLLQVWLKLGWELSLEHSWRGVGVDETLLVGLLRQRMLVWGPAGVCCVDAVCMLGAALVLRAVRMVCCIR